MTTSLVTGARRHFFRLKYAAPLAGGIAGIGLSVWLLKSLGFHRVGDLIAHAGWTGIAAVVAFHGLQVVCSALGWRAIAAPVARGSLRKYLLLRWIREGVNNLLPLAQIGGEVVAWRLLRRLGVELPKAIAGTVADLTLEMVTQALFALLGIALLVTSVGDSAMAAGIGGTLLTASGWLAALFVAFRLGLGQLIENALLRLGNWMQWAGAAHVEGLNRALLDCYRRPGKVASSALWHFLSWLLGGVEVCVALHFLGADVSIESGLIIESLGQAAKAMGFAIPGALGVQEGGYVMVCRALGLPSDMGLALSLLKRLREVAWGVPALVVWQRWESTLRAMPDEPLTESVR